MFTLSPTSLVGEFVRAVKSAAQWLVACAIIMAGMGLRLTIPDEVLDGWAEEGNKLINVASHLGLSDQLTAAILEAGEFDPEEAASSVAFVTDDEWETLIASLRVNEQPLTLGAKSKTRQLLVACRMTLPSEPDPVLDQGPAAEPTEGQQGAAPTPVEPPRTSTVDQQPAVGQAVGGQPLVESGSQSDGAAQAADQAETDQAKKKKEPVTTVVEDDFNTVSLGDTVLQGSTTKVKLIPLTKMREGRQRYREREGGGPGEGGGTDP